MTYVIIGGSAAGVSAAEAIRSVDKKAKITVISDEKLQLYSRCLLTYLIAGKIQKNQLLFKDKDFYKTNKIELISGVKAQNLDLKKKEVFLADKKKIKFDKLLIATGAAPKKLGIPGEELKGVFGLRSISDAEAIISMLDSVKNVVILGGGLIGLRDAYSLGMRGKKASVIVKSPQVLSQMLDKEGARIIEKRLSDNGIEIKKGLSAKKIIGKTKVEAVELDNGQKLECQMVIIGKGVTPNLDIIKGTGIKTNWGILVDNNLKTSCKDVYAAGDIAEGYDIAKEEPNVNAIWPVAIRQGEIAGLNMAGEKIDYKGSLGMNSIEFFDLPTISMGITKPKKAGYEELKTSDTNRNVYKKIILKDDIIKGMVLISDVENAGVYNILARRRINLSGIKDILLKDNFDYAKVIPLIRENRDKFVEEEFYV